MRCAVVPRRQGAARGGLRYAVDERGGCIAVVEPAKKMSHCLSPSEDADTENRHSGRGGKDQAMSENLETRAAEKGLALEMLEAWCDAGAMRYWEAGRGRRGGEVVYFVRLRDGGREGKEYSTPYLDSFPAAVFAVIRAAAKGEK